MTIYSDPIFRANANTICKDGTKKIVYFPYIVKTQVDKKYLIEVKLQPLLNNLDKEENYLASNEYLSYAITKKLDLLTNFSFCPAQKEYFLFSEHSIANVSEIIATHFENYNHCENLKFDLIDDNLSTYTQSYQLILPILKYYNGTIKRYGVPICLGCINEIDLNREWSQFKNHSDPILRKWGDIANRNLISDYVKKRSQISFQKKALLFSVGSFSKICLASDCNFPAMPGDDFCYSCAAHESD